MCTRKNTHPFVVVHEAAPVQHVHHGLKAEDGLPVELMIIRHGEGPSRQLDGLVRLCPSKLLLPHLHAQLVFITVLIISLCQLSID